ncbi:MAG: DUF72 domain-containing protein [Verrucomicrobiales bacterium]
MKTYVSTSGWYYWHWKGLFYPADLPGHKWFPFYRGHFKTVELNAPFYRWPLESTVKGWVRQATPRFKYCIKVNQKITHELKMAGTEQLIQDFYGMSRILKSKLGCFLFQFPPSFKYAPEHLASIIRQLDPAHKNAVEFRHKSWWNDQVCQAFQERGLIFCSISGPRFPEDLIRTADDIYVRFHGKDRWYRYDYSTEELQAWAEKIVNSGATTAWVYFNNDRDAHAIRNARKLKRLINQIGRGADVEEKGSSQ